MYRRPQFASMFEQESGSLAQNRIDVRLVKKDSYLYKPVQGADPELLRLFTPDGRGCFHPEDCPAGTSHHRPKLAFCFGQTSHGSYLPKLAPNAKRPPHSAAGIHSHDDLRRPCGQAYILRCPFSNHYGPSETAHGAGRRLAGRACAGAGNASAARGVTAPGVTLANRHFCGQSK
jgi:hypothetical protein